MVVYHTRYKTLLFLTLFLLIAWAGFLVGHARLGLLFSWQFSTFWCTNIHVAFALRRWATLLILPLGLWEQTKIEYRIVLLVIKLILIFRVTIFLQYAVEFGCFYLFFFCFCVLYIMGFSAMRKLNFRG